MKVPNLRSPCDNVGGIVHFGRMLDRARLHLKGQLPADYHANLGKGFDGRCCNLLRIKYEDLVERIKQGGTDEGILAWCFEHRRKPDPDEIEIWNEFMRKRGWRDQVSEVLAKRLKEAGFEGRTDIQTMFDFIDLDEGRDPKMSTPT